MSDKAYTIGFANMCESVPFSATVRAGLEAAAARYPNVKLVVRDNDLNNDQALANAHEFAELGVDLAIIYHIDERMGANIRSVLIRKRIPIIAVDIPIPMTVFFGINNQQAGYLAGAALGQWVQQHWDGAVDKVLVMTEQRALSAIRTRIASAVQGLADTTRFNQDHIFYLDGGTHQNTAYARSESVFKLWENVHRIAVICSNDDTAMGVITRARELGRQEDIAVIGQGANLAIDEFPKPGNRFIASTAYYPERYGEHLMGLALRMLNRERVPFENLIQPVAVTVDNYQAWLRGEPV
ncbi:MAG: substrate-binding domain-containing protein [Chloroflexi bacterium]|nr:substrate-binding domain-containing protein [Chloroflexota bacterium]